MVTFTVSLEQADVEALERFARARQTGIVAGHIPQQPLDTAIAKVLRASAVDWIGERTWIEPVDSTLTGGNA